MKKAEKDWILSLPKATKLSFIESALKKGDAGMALSLCMLFLDATITDGGISSEEISEVMDKDIFNIGDLPDEIEP